MKACFIWFANFLLSIRTVGLIRENQSKLYLEKTTQKKQNNKQQIQSNDISSET